MIDKQAMFRLFEASRQSFDLSLYARDIFEQAKKYLSYKENFVITGVRRSGKSSLLFMLMQELAKSVPKENIVYINFEDERFAFFEPQDFEHLEEYYYEYSRAKGKLFLFLDEIQNAKLWEKWLARSYQKHKFVITGSNSSLLASELVTAITGRYVELRVYPFAFKEFQSRLPPGTETAALQKNAFSSYLATGGFPEALLFGKKDLLQQYYQDILYRDVIAQYNIHYKELLERLSSYLISSLGKHISLYQLTKAYKVSPNTLKNYLGYLEKSFLFLFIDKFSFSLKKQQYNPPKVYCVDVGLAQAVNFRFSEEMGRLLENIVLLELFRKKYAVYYHKEKHECDFVVKEGMHITKVFQVCTKLTQDNEERELSGLLDAMDIFKLKEGMILTQDQDEERTIKGKRISIKPIWRWLLE